MFSGNAYTENIFDCETNDNDLPANVHKGKLVIKVDDKFTYEIFAKSHNLTNKTKNVYFYI